MQLTMFSDLSLRVIMYLAAGEPGRKYTAGEIAEAFGASKAHVAKVVTRLASMGLVSSTKGRGGGIVLSEGAERQSVGALLREIEHGEVVDCSSCVLSQNCLLRGQLARAQEAFFATLDPVTIRDVAGPPGQEVPLGIAGARG